LFNGIKYVSWIIGINIYLKAYGFGIQELVTIDYTDEARKESSEK
jgi:hypothetical protein